MLVRIALLAVTAIVALPLAIADPSFAEAKLPPVAKANIAKLKELKAKRQGCE